MSANRRVGVEVFANASQARTELQGTAADVKGIGTASEEANAKAAAAANGLSGSAKTQAAALGAASVAASGTSNSLGILLSRQQQLAAESQRLSQGISLLQRVIEKTPDSTGLLSSKMQELLLAKQAVSKESAVLNNQIKAETAVVEATTSVWQRKTNMLNTGAGALRGYDQIAQTLIRTAGGITIAWATAIQIGSALLPVLLNLGGSKKELESVTNELIESDALLADAFRRVGSAGQEVNGVVKSQAEIYRQLLETDLFAQFVAIEDQYKKVADAAGKAVTTQDDYRNSQSELAKINDVLTGKQETNGQSLDRLKTRQEALLVLNESQRHSIQETDAARGKEEDTLNTLIASLVRYSEVTGKNREEILAQARSAIQNEEVFARLRAQFDETTISVQTLTDALGKLSTPQFNIAATPQGIDELQDAVLKGLRATYEKGIGGTATQVNSFEAQVRALSPTLRTLDEAIKRNSVSVADYHRQIQGLNEVVRTALLEHQRQEQAYKQNFDTRRKQTLDMLSLEKEAKLAAIRAEREGLDEKEALIKAEFEFRRRELEKNGQLTQAALGYLRAIELRQLTELNQERIKLYQKEQFEQRKFLEEGRETRLRLQKEAYEAERRVILQEQRKTRIVLETEDTAFRKNRSNRSGRAEQETGVESRQAQDQARVNRLFGQGSRNAELYRLQLALINGELTEQQAQYVILRTAIEQFQQDWIESGAIFAQVGQGIGNALQGVIANGESFGTAMKVMFLNLIADIAAYWGSLYVGMGAGMILTDPARGAKLIAAGVALLALAGALRGVASLIQQNAQSGSGGGSAASGGSGSGSAASGAGGAAAGERSRFSPGGEFRTNAERIAAIDRRIGQLAAQIGAGNSITDKYFRRQIQLLEDEKRALGAIGPSIAREIGKVMRVPINTTGSGPLPIFNLFLDSSETARLTMKTLEGQGVVTVRSAGGRHNRKLRKKLK